MLIYKHWFWFFLKKRNFLRWQQQQTNKLYIWIWYRGGGGNFFRMNECLKEKSWWKRCGYDRSMNFDVYKGECVCVCGSNYIWKRMCVCVYVNKYEEERERRDCLQWNFLQIGWLGKFNFCFEYQFSVCSNWP